MGIRRSKGADNGEKWLEVDASMTGSLTFKDPVNLSINGKFEGTLDTRGHLSVGEQAQVKATINGEKVVVGGTVTGDIKATNIVEVLQTGRVEGKIQAPRLVVHDGAVIQGILEMGSKGGSESMTMDELAGYLEVEVGTVQQWAQEGRLPGKREGNTWQFQRSKIESWLAQEKIK